MKLVVFLAGVLSVSMAWSQQRSGRSNQVASEILELVREINTEVRSGDLSRETLEDVRDQLRGVVDSMYGAPSSSSKLICTKQSNSLFYPTDSTNGQVVGTTSYNAGYSSLEDCRSTLPTRGERITCFKQSNSLFFPSRLDGSVIGSTSYNAGHSSISDCKATLPRRRAVSACFKQSNGLYYPVTAETGAVIGSTSYNAGFSDHQSCLKVINQ